MGRGFTIFDHPSDLGITAKGATLSEAFEEAARGLISIIADLPAVRPSVSRSISCTASDTQQLLVKWLSEILYLYDGQQFIAGEFHVEKLTETGLEGYVRGEPFSAVRHHPRTDVKAITYHQVSVRNDQDGAEVNVVVDI